MIDDENEPDESRRYSAQLILHETRRRKVFAVVEADSAAEAKELFAKGKFREVGGEVGGTRIGAEVTDISDFMTPEMAAEIQKEEDRIQAIEKAWKAKVDAALPIGRCYYSVGEDPDQMAFAGTAVIRCDFAWVQDGCSAFESEVVTNPTWLQVAVIADRMIDQTGDHHHIFLEGVAIDRKRTDADDRGIDIYQLYMGS